MRGFRIPLLLLLLLLGGELGAQVRTLIKNEPKKLTNTRPVQRIYVTLKLDTRDFSVEVADADKDGKFGKNENIRLNISGKFLTAWNPRSLEILPAFNDGNNVPRSDLSVEKIFNLKNASYRNGTNGEIIIKLRQNAEFAFSMNVQTSKDFNLDRDLVLHVPILVNGDEAGSKSIALKVASRFPFLLLLLGAGVLVCGGLVSFFLYKKGKGIDHGKYLFQLRGVEGKFSGTEFILLEESHIIGRMPPGASGFILNGEKVSRQHSIFVRSPLGYTVSDSNSTNGTFVNGARVQPGKTILLKDGDIVQIGNIRLAYSAKKR